MQKWFAAALLLLCATASERALAFGTISFAGQDREHERITRRALACGRAPASVTCFQPRSIGELAGGTGTFGAVGAPDDPTRGLLMSSPAHCDGGDHLAVAGYPPPKEPNALVRCRRHMSDNIVAAVTDATRLLDSSGAIDDSQIPTIIACTFDGTKGRAKCNVLEDFGLTLHAAQDFYAHTNWTDSAVPSPAPGTPANPPGLGNSGAAPFLDLSRMIPLPAGLISGCFVFKPESAFCNDGAPGGVRVKHLALNKDSGQIDPSIGAGAPGTRGAIGGNFARAVEAAVEDTRNKWAFLQDQIIARHGSARGRMMICAITHDDPKKTCRSATEPSGARFAMRGLTLLLALMFAFLIYSARGMWRPRAPAAPAA
jgi:hypothetical protein